MSFEIDNSVVLRLDSIQISKGKNVPLSTDKITRAEYSSVPNRRVGWNKPAGGKILKKQ